MLRIQPLRVQRDEAIYECTATNSLGEINTSAKLSVLEGMCWEETWHAGNLLAKRTDGISDFKEFIFYGEGTDSEQIMSCRIKWEGGYSYINRFQYT